MFTTPSALLSTAVTPTTATAKSTNQPSPILRLPAELLHTIVKLLPASSTAALTLTNKCLSMRVGTSSWEIVKRDHGQRRKFLMALERDLPDHFLHDRLRKRIPNRFPTNCSQFDNPSCSTSQGICGNIWKSGLAIQFNGPMSQPLSNIINLVSSMECRWTRWSAKLRRILKRGGRFRVSPRIVNGHVLLKVTYTMTESDPADVRDLELQICQHSNTMRKTYAWSEDNLASQLIPFDYTATTAKYRRVFCEYCQPPWYHDDSDCDFESFADYLGRDPKSLIAPAQCTYCLTEYKVITTKYCSKAMPGCRWN